MSRFIAITNDASKANAITHGGIFHTDEVMATVILSRVFDSLTVYRTFKVPENVREDAIVYDIGHGEYDHHQPGGNGQRKNEVPYAACGLIWKKFGPEIVKNTCNPKLVWNLIDKNLIQGIDAMDNGVIPKVEYPTPGVNLANIMFQFNPAWNASDSADEAFLKAMKFAEMIFDQFLESAIARAEGFDAVEAAIEATEGNIMVLERYLPWGDFIFGSQNPKAANIEFVVFPSLRGGYNFQCVPDAPGSRGQKKPVPSEWRGLKDEELQKVSGVATANFCHPAGFIGGAGTLEDAIKLCELASQS